MKASKAKCKNKQNTTIKRHENKQGMTTTRHDSKTKNFKKHQQ
jgi:hypothetical protein